MATVAALYVIAAVLFVLLDAIWLGYAAKGIYAAELGPLLLASPNLLVAAGFYALYLAGLLVFVIHPAARADSVLHALIYGAFFGLIAYGTYDLTNLATLRGFTPRIAMIDMAWGCVLTASVCSGAVILARILKVI